MNFEWLFNRSFRYLLSLFLLGLIILGITLASMPFLSSNPPELWVSLFMPFNITIGIILIAGSVIFGLLYFIKKIRSSHDQISSLNQNNIQHSINIEQLDFVTRYFSSDNSPNQHRHQNKTSFSLKIKEHFHIFKKFISEHYPFVKSLFPPWLIFISGISLDLMVALDGLSKFFYGAQLWNELLSGLPVFPVFFILLFLPVFILPALRELTSAWGEIYFSFPTRRKTYLIGRYYMPTTLALLVVIGIPIIISMGLGLYHYHTLFPTIIYPGYSPPVVVAFPIDPTMFTLFFITSLGWYILFILVFGLIFFYLLIYLRRSLSLGVYFLLVIGYFVFFMPSTFYNSPFVITDIVGILPAALVYQILPRPIAITLPSYNIVYPTPPMSPLLGLLLLFIGMVIEILILAGLSFLIIQRMKLLERQTA